MAYWNHFAKSKYKPIHFRDLKIGDKFRNHFFKNKRRRIVICVKTGELTYIEQKNKEEHKLFHDNFEVYEY